MVAPPADRLPQNFLGQAARVAVRRVEHGETGFQADIHHSRQRWRSCQVARSRVVTRSSSASQPLPSRRPPTTARSASPRPQRRARNPITARRVGSGGHGDLLPPAPRMQRSARPAGATPRATAGIPIGEPDLRQRGNGHVRRIAAEAAACARSASALRASASSTSARASAGGSHRTSMAMMPVAPAGTLRWQSRTIGSTASRVRACVNTPGSDGHLHRPPAARPPRNYQSRVSLLVIATTPSRVHLERPLDPECGQLIDVGVPRDDDLGHATLPDLVSSALADEGPLHAVARPPGRCRAATRGAWFYLSSQLLSTALVFSRSPRMLSAPSARRH